MFHFVALMTATMPIMQTSYHAKRAPAVATNCRASAKSSLLRLGGALSLLWLVCGIAGASVPGEQALIGQVTSWVASAHGVEQDSIEVIAPDRRIQVPLCRDQWRFDFPFSNRETVRARCEMPAQQFYLRTRLQPPSAGFLASRALRAGHVILSSDLIGATGNGTASVLQRFDPVGRQLRRFVAAGERITEKDLHPAVAPVFIYRTKVAMRAGQALERSDIEREPASPADLAGRAFRGPLPEKFVLARDLSPGAILKIEDQAQIRTVLVARNSLPRGSRLTPAMVEVKDLAAAGQPLAHTLTSPDGIIDMEATRDLRAGDALRASDVRPAVLVRKGDLVTLTAARTTGLTIRARVEALQDGRRGESIKIKNKESGQVLTGVVSGLNSVEAL